MIGTRNTPRRIGLLGVAVITMGLPACHSARPWTANPADGSGRVAYRPVHTSLRGRPFYVSGYGGADYSPARPRRRGALVEAPAGAAPASVPGPSSVTVSQGTWEEP